MTNLNWADLPELIRVTVEDEVGKIVAAVVAEANVPGVAARVNGERSACFFKAIPIGDPLQRLYRQELHAAQVLPREAPAPRLLIGGEVDGWLSLVYELTPGWNADLSPGSTDLGPVSRLLRRLKATVATTPWPDAPAVSERTSVLFETAQALLHKAPSDLRELKRYDALLTDFVDLSRELSGGALIHYDLSPGSIRVNYDTAMAVDWAFACRAAAWVEGAALVPWLIQAGHTAQEAEEFVTAAGRPLPDSQIVVAFAAVWTMVREYLARYGPEGLREARAQEAAAGRTWVRHRL